MKYQLKCLKNNDKKTIEEVWVTYGNKEIERVLEVSKEKFNRKISTKQLCPITMNCVLRYYHEGKNISEISRLVGFSRKAISENIKKSIEIKIFWKVIKKGSKKINYCNIITNYSIDKWISNWQANSYQKKEVWNNVVSEEFKYFLDWWNRTKDNKTIFPIRISADYIIYQYQTRMKPSKVPTKQAIYKWVKEKKYNFSPKYFIKLSYGMYYKKPHKFRKNRIYDDSSKSILNFKSDMMGKTLENAYEIDLVKGKKNDKYSILTCINKLTRLTYAIITKADAISVKNNLLKIINKNNLKIDQLVIDNGSENVLLHEIKSIKQIYRCRPYCSSDKGQIENVHRLLRYWIKKGSSIDLIIKSYQNKSQRFLAIKILH